MSRSGYSHDNDGVAMWRGMVASATRGKRGQQFLKDLLAALDVLPEKRLIADQLQESPTGEVCAIGALGKARGIDMTSIDPECPEQVAPAFNIAECLAQEVVYMNDEYSQHVYVELPGPPRAWRQHDCLRRDITPEERWQYMRDWVSKQIRPVPQHSEQHSGESK